MGSHADGNQGSEHLYAVGARSYLVYALFPQLLLALWDRRANRWGSALGMAVSAAIRAGAGEPLLGLPMLLPLPVDAAGAVRIPIKSIAMLAGLVSMWLVSRVTAGRCAPVALSAHSHS